MRSLLSFAVLLLSSGIASAVVLNANATANNGGSAGWGIFFDVQSTAPGAITQMSTASTATAGAAFSVQIFTRSGSALGGPVTAGPGSSSSGWTSLGTANATQGGTSSGISQLFAIPSIPVSNAVTGVAVIFSGAGPRYFGTGTGAPQVFTDGVLTLTTGDARSVPFTTTGSFFSPRGLAGALVYEIPEPASLSLIGAMGAMLALRRR